MLFVVLCPGTPEGSTGSGSGFKASQKTGQQLKVSSDRLGEFTICYLKLLPGNSKIYNLLGKAFKLNKCQKF